VQKSLVEFALRGNPSPARITSACTPLLLFSHTPSLLSSAPLHLTQNLTLALAVSFRSHKMHAAIHIPNPPCGNASKMQQCKRKKETVWEEGSASWRDVSSTAIAVTSSQKGCFSPGIINNTVSTHKALHYYKSTSTITCITQWTACQYARNSMTLLISKQNKTLLWWQYSLNQTAGEHTARSH